MWGRFACHVTQTELLLLFAGTFPSCITEFTSRQTCGSMKISTLCCRALRNHLNIYLSAVWNHLLQQNNDSFIYRKMTIIITLGIQGKLMCIFTRMCPRRNHISGRQLQGYPYPASEKFPLWNWKYEEHFWRGCVQPQEVDQPGFRFAGSSSRLQDGFTTSLTLLDKEIGSFHGWKSMWTVCAEQFVVDSAVGLCVTPLLI